MVIKETNARLLHTQKELERLHERELGLRKYRAAEELQLEQLVESLKNEASNSIVAKMQLDQWTTVMHELEGKTRDLHIQIFATDPENDRSAVSKDTLQMPIKITRKRSTKGLAELKYANG